MRRLAAILLAVALVPACEHMGRGGGGGFGHSNYAGGGGGSFHPSGAHAPSSSLGPSRWEESTASKVGRAVIAGTAAAALQAAGVPAETGDDDDGDGTIDSQAAQPVLRAPVGDLCLDCPDAGNCNSCPGPRGVP